MGRFRPTSMAAYYEAQVRGCARILDRARQRVELLFGPSEKESAMTETIEYKASPPMGYETSCEPSPDGWAMWKPREDGKPPCGNEACEEPYNEEEPAFALECPSCGEPGCDVCFYAGRGCACPACEDKADGF